MSRVSAVAAALREQILDGALPAGAPLREAHLAEAHGAARHSVRAALRELAAEGLVVVEPNRGARVAELDAAAVVALYELRTALEVEAAHLALARHGGRLPPAVHEAAEALARACTRSRPSWLRVSAAHGDLHAAIVAAASSERIERAHSRLTAETQLFLLRVRPYSTYAGLAADHLELVAGLEADGPEVLRSHLRASAALLVDEL